MRTTLYQVQPVELIVDLGPVATKKFGTSDVTKFLEEVHAEVVGGGGTPLSFTVLSGYEAHWEPEQLPTLAHAQTNNLAVIQVAWVAGNGHPEKEMEYYCARLIDRFNLGGIAMKIHPLALVQGYIKE